MELNEFVEALNNAIAKEDEEDEDVNESVGTHNSKLLSANTIRGSI